MSPLSLSFTAIPLKSDLPNEDHRELELEFPRWMSSMKKKMHEALSLKVEGRTVKKETSALNLPELPSTSSSHRMPIKSKWLVSNWRLQPALLGAELQIKEDILRDWDSGKEKGFPCITLLGLPPQPPDTQYGSVSTALQCCALEIYLFPLL